MPGLAFGPRILSSSASLSTQQGRSVVTVRTLPIGKRPEVAPARKSYAFALATLVLDLCKEMSLSAVAKHLQLDWHLCKDILKSDLGRRRERIRLRRVRRSAPTASFGSVAS